MEQYFSGGKLYGDDFEADEITAWYSDEKEGYANLGAKETESYRYPYHAAHWFHAFRHLPQGRLKNVLGFGSAYGHELQGVLDRTMAITIVDPSDAFVRRCIGNVPVKYVKPHPSGDLPFPDETFDLVTCFGVLHHIPNVSHVLTELTRVLTRGGHLAVREPIVSMGDWRMPRAGLTKRERGIPLRLLDAAVQSCHLENVHTAFCEFPLTPLLFRPIRGRGLYNSRAATWVDAKLAAAFAWKQVYHPRTVMQKIQPASVYMVLRKPI